MPTTTLRTNSPYMNTDGTQSQNTINWEKIRVTVIIINKTLQIKKTYLTYTKLPDNNKTQPQITRTTMKAGLLDQRASEKDAEI